MTLSFARRGLDPQDSSLGRIGEEIDEPVRPLAHVADALAQLAQDALLAHDLVAVELEPCDERAGERADERVAQPGNLSPV
jgi:hypothetical protein